MITAKHALLCLAAAFCLLTLTGGTVVAQEAAATENVVAPVMIMDAPPTEEGASLIISADGTLVPADTLVAPEAHGEEAHGGGGGGFPQLDVSTYSSQIFWLIVSFALLYTLMSRLALPRINEVIDLRQTQLNCNLDRATQLNDEAGKMKAEFEKLLGNAQASAKAAVDEVEQKVNERMAQEGAKFADHARARIAEVEISITKAKTEALASLGDIAADVAVDMVARVSGANISKTDAKTAVQRHLAKA